MSYVPTDMANVIKQNIDMNDCITEIRVRANLPVIVKTFAQNKMEKPRQSEYVLSDYIATETLLDNIFNIITEYSAYAYEEAIRQGYITVKGGHRIGICGRCTFENGKVKYINNVSYINMRVSHEMKGCGDEIYREHLRDKRFKNTLLISPPGMGKTTLLRDLIRNLSNEGYDITVIDERNEIGACFKGCAQNDLGRRTDVFSDCNKIDGILMAIRTMAPQIIAVDEIGDGKELEALKKAYASGVGVIATIHGNSIEKLSTEVIELFENKILISKPGEYIWL